MKQAWLIAVYYFSEILFYVDRVLFFVPRHLANWGESALIYHNPIRRWSDRIHRQVKAQW